YNGDKSILYVQEIEGQVVETFKEGEIIVDWMHAATDIDHQYFGWSGLEETHKELKGTIDALRYNMGNFTQSRSPKGFFSTEAELEEHELDELEERFDGYFSDPAKQHRVMFFAGDAALKWTPLNQSNKD